MVCPNCQSTDIITVQGENFCIACGHVVLKSPKTKAAPTIEELTKIQAKVAHSDEMAVLVGEQPETASAEPLAPKIRGLGPKLRAEDTAKAAPVTVQVTPGADQATAAAAQAELAQAVEKAMAPAPDQPQPLSAAEPAQPVIVKHKSRPAEAPKPAEESETPESGLAKSEPAEASEAKPSIIRAAISRFATPAKADGATAEEAQSDETPLPTPPAAAKATTPAASKRRKPGRPKAGRLDVPKPTAAAPVQPVSAVITAPVLAAAPRLRPSGSGPRSVTDLRPVSASGPAAAEPKSAPAAPPPSPSSTPDSLTALDTTSTISQPLMVDELTNGLGSVTRMSLHERVHPASFLWSLLPATFLALLVGGMTLAMISSRLDAAVAATQRAGWAVWGEALLILGLYYLGHSLVGAAIVFGIARRVAHRPVPAGRQFGAAVNTWLSRLALDLAVLLLQLVIVALIIGLAVAGSFAWPVPEWAHIAGLFVGFLALVYIIAGLMLSQGLGRVGLTVSSLSAGHALKLGWRLFWGHFELAGFRTLALLLELILLVPFTAAAVALVFLVPPAFSWAAVLGIVLLSTIAGALAGAGTAAWWEGAYRHLIERDYQDESGRLLGGRPAERPRPFALTTLIMATTILIGLSIAWPWLPLP